VIVLAHNASTQQVPFDFGRLVDESAGSIYMLALEQVTDQVAKSNEKAANKST
jgi:hypothetical protein